MLDVYHKCIYKGNNDYYSGHNNNGEVTCLVLLQMNPSPTICSSMIYWQSDIRLKVNIKNPKIVSFLRPLLPYVEMLLQILLCLFQVMGHLLVHTTGIAPWVPVSWVIFVVEG